MTLIKNNTQEMKELLEAYGFTLEFERPESKLTRFRDERVFIDMWNGTWGITIGVQNPRTRKTRYTKKCTIGRLEDELISLSKI